MFVYFVHILIKGQSNSVIKGMVQLNNRVIVLSRVSTNIWSDCYMVL